jgi:asparagine synthase (glutamine-hydrolysing)
MCGISGSVTNRVLPQSTVDKVHKIQHHRGPDGKGTKQYKTMDFKHITLLHQRLSIIDIEGGSQPMEDTKKTLSIVFNGEIFNHEDLKKDLLKKNYTFETDHSDTEVLLYMYKEYGKEMLSKLNGMFAFVIYDKENEVLFIARDRTGIKPLYYSMQGVEFYFASELKTMLEYGLKRELDMQSVANYLSFQFIPAPATIFKGMKKLESAHYATYDIKTTKFTIKKYWDISFNEVKKSKSEIKKDLFEQLEKSIKLWSKSDVKTAVSLSGGVDSTTIISLMKGKLNSFSLGFKDATPELDELDLAKIVADKVDSVHHEYLIEVKDVLDELDNMVYHLDEPYAGGLPSWFIYKAMKGKVKVAFSGTGGDELFGNYNKHIVYKDHLAKNIYRFYNRNKGNLCAQIVNYVKYPKATFYHKFFNYSEIKNLLKIQTFTSPDKYIEEKIENSKTVDARNFVPYVDFKMQLPEEFLQMTDRFSMAFSIEARTPMLDHNLIKLVMSIPSDIRTKEEDPKYLLKEVVSELLPSEILTASKKGFVIPQGKWIRTELKELVEELLGEAYLKKQAIFNPNIYELYVKPHMEGENGMVQKVWTLLMFQLWYKKFIEELYEK